MNYTIVVHQSKYKSNSLHRVFTLINIMYLHIIIYIYIYMASRINIISPISMRKLFCVHYSKQIFESVY